MANHKITMSEEWGKILCGISRPIHFNGVAQVVSRLFDIVKPNYAVFGEKDYQQLLIIKSLVERKDIKTTIVSVPTVRESDGLAMSTRNSYLSSQDRTNAALFYQQLVAIKLAIQSGNEISGADKSIDNEIVNENVVLDEGENRIFGFDFRLVKEIPINYSI